MKIAGRRCLLCSCGDTFELHGEQVARALGTSAPERQHRELCRAQIDAYKAALATGEPLLVACEQEAPLFRELAEETGADVDLRFVDIRDRAGWSEQGAAAAPKIAALLAEGTLDCEPPPSVTMRSQGRILVYGRDELAIEAARRLADRLLPSAVLTGEEEVLPPRVWEVPLFRGKITAARGHLGAFKVDLDAFAPALPSSRDALAFSPSTRRETLDVDLLLDLAGGTPLFPAAEKRDGYLRADPSDPAAVERALFAAADLVGEFEKPRYVRYDAEICAHARSRVVGCTRCLDVCPTGAIAPADDAVTFDPFVCAGCGSCSGVCPTGAASYASPPPVHLVERLRMLLRTFAAAGGNAPEVLIYEDRHGGELLSVLARVGRGLPAATLPFRVTEIGQLGIEHLASALAYGARRVIVLAPPRKRPELAGLEGTVEVVRAVLEGLGHGADRLQLVFEDDPDAVDALVWSAPEVPPLLAATHTAIGDKRQLARLAFDHLHAQASAPPEFVPLPAGAPFGTVEVNVDGCTLCLSCVGACPTGALVDNPDAPMLRFRESACVQCGLCRNTCPEKVISLRPRLGFGAVVDELRLIKEEEPATCIRCGKAFGVRSSIERIVERLAGSHWMFQSPEQIERLRMCDDCRIAAEFEGKDRAFTLASPRRPRTTEDYLREREEIETARRRLRTERQSGDGTD